MQLLLMWRVTTQRPVLPMCFDHLQHRCCSVPLSLTPETLHYAHSVCVCPDCQIYQWTVFITLTGWPCYWWRSVFSASRDWIFCITWMNVKLRLIVSRSFELTVSPWTAATSRTGEHGGGDDMQENKQSVCWKICAGCLSDTACVRAMFTCNRDV